MDTPTNPAHPTQETPATLTAKPAGPVKSAKGLRASLTWLVLKPFSVNRVKKERLIREIMVMESLGQIFKWIPDDPFKPKFDASLEHAKNLTHQRKFEKGWGYLLNAELFMINALDEEDEEELTIRAKMILLEAEKINSAWRIAEIKTLLGEDTKHLNTIRKTNLLKAVTVKNDYYLTRNHKIDLHRVNANILTLAMILILASILILSRFWNITGLEKLDDISFSKSLVISAIFGALGAGFSYGKTLFSYNPELNKIPDQLLSMTVTIFRFIVGASSAIISLLFLRSAFLNELFSNEIRESPITYMVFSFVAGFSERWVVKMIGLVTKEKENE